MAANKFATMLHRNTNNMTLILVYAILEWILIVLLLLNSIFSYLIVKFCNYFGLKRPCVLCSRLDHIFEPGKKKNFHRDLVCEAHASEISKLSFCLNHQKLVESQSICEDCSSSMQPDCSEWSKKFDFFPWTKQIAEGIENAEENLKCSCCGVKFKHKLYSPCTCNKPSLEVLDYTQKGILIADDVFDDKSERGDHSHQSRSEFTNYHLGDEKVIEEKGGYKMVSDVDDDLGRREEEAKQNGSYFSYFCCRKIEANEEEKVCFLIEKEHAQEPNKEEILVLPEEDQVHCRNDVCPEIVPRDFEFYIEGDDYRLVPIELKSSITTDNVIHHKIDEVGNSHIEGVILDFDMNVRPKVEEVTETWKCSGENNFSVVELADLCESESFLVVHTEEGDSLTWEFQQAVTPQATQTLANSDDKVSCQANGAMTKEDINLDVQQGTEIPSHESKDDIKSQESDDDIHMRIDDNEPAISIGTEIPDHESNDGIKSHEILPAYPSELGDPSTGTLGFHIDPSNHDSEKAEEEFGEFKTFSVEINQKAVNDHLASKVNEVEDERAPDTSIDSLHLLPKKFLVLERKESGTEESLDGSFLSDIDASDGVLTNEKLKSALRAERKALHALYAELEEERSASAVAANQTMAMINRIQEEKAAMQMEALQYQRMMEEQSEYDQEALQLMNELMVKREKEKQELEKELEMYRKKVQEYEAKEKLMLRKMKDCRTSSMSCSNAEDSDCLSIDLNNEAREEEDGFYSHEDVSNQNTPADADLYLVDSLSGFEEERLSILDQLRVLEEKLCTLSDEEEQLYKETRPMKCLHTENVNGYREHLDVGNQANGVANGHLMEMNGKHHQVRRIMDAKAKILLPLFNATETETEDVDLNGNKDGFHSDKVFTNFSITEIERENKKLSIEEEVNRVYERLQALEEDREFLKHCISSLRKGDKGLILLQEILHHLRNLRSVELHTRNMGDGVI